MRRFAWRLVALAAAAWIGYSAAALASIPGGEAPEAGASGAVLGELVLPDRRDETAEVRVRLGPVPGPARGAEPGEPRELTCPVEGRRVTRCQVPAGRWDLRLTVAPFAPLFFWDRRVEPGEDLDLGTLALRRGGSVVGRIVTEQGALDPLRARLRLRPLQAGEPQDRALRERLGGLTTRGEVRTDGSFDFLGVPAGAYEVEVSHPGFVTATRRPVEVEAGAWTEIAEPLVLELPLRLLLALEPAAEPSGEPWQLELYRVEEPATVREAAGGRSDAAGFWESPPLPAGRYALRVLAADGDAFLWRELDLARGNDVHAVEIPVVLVAGRVLLGDGPLEAAIWFGGWNGAAQVETSSDEAGEFSVVLPREGEWRVDVRAGSPPVVSRGLRVEVERRDGGEPAEVTIEVPDTALLGQVVDELGRSPGSVARVDVLRVDGDAGVTSTETSATGGIELYGLPPGFYQVGAETADASASPVVAQVREDAETGVRLVLRARRELTGTVLSDAGAVPAAEVLVHFTTGTGAPAGMVLEDGRTGPDGRFALTAPAQATTARLVVMAPGFPLTVLSVPATEPATVVLDRAAGTLGLRGIDDLLSVGDGSSIGLLLIDGEPIDLHRLLAWARLQRVAPAADGSLTVSAMPPGEYALCALSLGEALLVLDGAALPTSDACTEGYLPPGGELHLAL